MTSRLGKTGVAAARGRSENVPQACRCLAARRLWRGSLLLQAAPALASFTCLQAPSSCSCAVKYASAQQPSYRPSSPSPLCRPPMLTSDVTASPRCYASFSCTYVPQPPSLRHALTCRLKVGQINTSSVPRHIAMVNHGRPFGFQRC